MGLFDFLKNKANDDNLYGNCNGVIKRKDEFLEEDRYKRNDEFNSYYNEGFCMTIDDIFTITGRGTVVTGKVESGDIRLHDRVKIQRNGSIVLETEVIGIEMFRKLLDYAKIWDNLGVLLRGVTKNDLCKGDKLIK